MVQPGMSRVETSPLIRDTTCNLGQHNLLLLA